jgi:hypothetical protein
MRIVRNKRPGTLAINVNLCLSVWALFRDLQLNEYFCGTIRGIGP